MIEFSTLDVSKEISPQDDMNFGESAVWYFSAGESALRRIVEALQAAGKNEVPSILDLPSGYGRVLRYLRAFFPQARITACDLNQEAAEFCARTFGATARVSSIDLANLSLGERYDLIWCGSLFTHLDAGRWKELLGFFLRHLEEDGVLVFSTHGRQAREFCRQRHAIYGLSEPQFARIVAEEAATGFGYVSYDDAYPHYGISLSSPAWVMALLSGQRDLLISSFVESGWGSFHDIYGCQRRRGVFPGAGEVQIADPDAPAHRARVGELEMALREKERALDKILGSRGWHALSSLYRAREWLGASSRLQERLPGATESLRGFCPVCGRHTRFDSWEPPGIECRRNTFVCRTCKSVSRNRHVARTILDTFPTSPHSHSLRDFARRNDIRLLHTCASGSLHEVLKASSGYLESEFHDDIPSGSVVNGVICQNLEETTFCDAAFDLVITEDILEHVADPRRACRELRRILKPGGYHISTIAVYWDKPCSVRRAELRDGRVEHLLDPVYHGDPNRPEGALVFVDFGADLVGQYLSETGPTEVLWSHQLGPEQRRCAIYDNMVFVSRRPA